MLAEAQEAADIGAQFGDLVVWRSQDCRNLTDVLAVAAIHGFPDPGLGLLLGDRRLRGKRRTGIGCHRGRFDVLK